jgi:lipoprotein-releasing system permease protein
MGYPTQIAARYLRSKKRNAFISVITFISVAGVALGVATLCVVLSVMSGFESDLKRKILGNNSHLLVLKFGTDFYEYPLVTKKAREQELVAGATPFVLSEVMISTQLNTSGVLIKGIDPDTVGEVSDLPNNLLSGEIGFLKQPEKIPLGRSMWSHVYKPGQEPSGPRNIPGVATPTAIHTPPGSAPMPEALATALGTKAATKTGQGTPPGVPKGFIDPFDDDADEPLKDEPVRPGIFLGKELSSSLHASIGDIVHVISPLGDGTVGPTGPIPKTRTFRVAGIFYSGFYEYDAKFVFVAMSELQDFMGLRGLATGVELKLKNIDKAEEVSKGVLSALGGFPFRTKDWREMNRNLFQALQLEKVVMFVILIFIVLVASFNIISTLYMFVTEKEKEIAILKSMGATDGDVRSIFMRIGLIIGIVGTTIGEIIGLGLCLFVEKHGIHLDPDVYYIDRLPIQMSGIEFLVVAVAAVTISFLATIPPAQLAVKLKPVDGLRFD